MTIEIPDVFAWPVLVAACIGFQCVLTSFLVSRARRKFFSKNFFEENFPELKPVPLGGYPDMGCGRFSDKLSLQEWTEFNNAQRCHQNYVEGVSQAISLVLLSGLFFPRISTLFGIIYLIGRFLYAFGYSTKGAPGRLVGILLVDIALLVLFISTLYGAYQAGGGCAGFMKLLGGCCDKAETIAATTAQQPIGNF